MPSNPIRPMLHHAAIAHCSGLGLGLLPTFYLSFVLGLYCGIILFFQHFYVLEAVYKSGVAGRETAHISFFCYVARWSQNSIKLCLVMEVVTINHSI